MLGSRSIAGPWRGGPVEVKPGLEAKTNAIRYSSINALFNG